MNPLCIGLTGGIASGKSQISLLFAKKLIHVIDADAIARDLFKPGAAILNKLKERFGSQIFETEGVLNRQTLATIVFNSELDLKWLNQLTHPLIAKEIKRQIARSSSAYVIIDIPLLIDQSGMIRPELKQLIDRVLVINVSMENQITRLCKRDNISITDAKKIISHQSTLAQKLPLADDVINNNGQIKELDSQVTQLHNQYLFMTSKEVL